MTGGNASRRRVTFRSTPNTAVAVTHLLWAGRWVEAVKTVAGWRFKNGRDAADWLVAE